MTYISYTTMVYIDTLAAILAVIFGFSLDASVLLLLYATFGQILCFS